MVDKEILDQVAACPHCGQIVTVKLRPGELPESAAERVCDCPEAKRIRRREERLLQANQTIEDTFGAEGTEKYGLKEQPEGTLELLRRLAQMLVDDQIVSATVQCADSCKAKLAIGAKGEIKITSTEGWSINLSV